MKVNSWKLLLLMLLSIPSGVYAQDEKTLWIDAKAGFNSIWIFNQNAYGNREMAYGTSFGLTGGLGINYFINEDWGFNTSPGYIRLGQNYNDNSTDGNSSRKVKLSYIKVPLLITKKVQGSNNPTWIAFGPELLFLTSAKQEFTLGEGDTLYNAATMVNGDVKERFKPFDMALAFSINKMFELRSSDNMMFFYSFNTSIGLLDINSKDWQLPNKKNEYAGSHNFYFGLTAGLMFNATRRK